MDPTKLPLRDFHLPNPIGWWPVAPGWWILLFSGVLLVVFSAWLWKRFNSFSLKKLAKKELKDLRRMPDLSNSERIKQLSVLIRRVCISLYPRSTAARLTGNEWLKFLEQPLGDESFSHGVGRVLIDAPYQRDRDIDSDSLFSLCERWIDALPDKKVAESDILIESINLKESA